MISSMKGLSLSVGNDVNCERLFSITVLMFLPYYSLGLKVRVSYFKLISILLLSQKLIIFSNTLCGNDRASSSKSRSYYFFMVYLDCIPNKCYFLLAMSFSLVKVISSILNSSLSKNCDSILKYLTLSYLASLSFW